MNLFSDIIQPVSVIIAAGTAIYGINKWRTEAKWKRKFEIGEDVLTLFYECKERLEIIRHPLTYSNEGKSRKRSEHETERQSKILDSAYVYFERYENEKEPFIKLWSLKFRFMALFGKESGRPFDEVRRILNDVFIAARRLGEQYWQDRGRKDTAFDNEQEFQDHLKEMHEYEETIWSRRNDADKMNIEFDKCIKQIEKYLSKIIT